MVPEQCHFMFPQTLRFQEAIDWAGQYPVISTFSGTVGLLKGLGEIGIGAIYAVVWEDLYDMGKSGRGNVVRGFVDIFPLLGNAIHHEAQWADRCGGKAVIGAHSSDDRFESW